MSSSKILKYIKSGSPRSVTVKKNILASIILKGTSIIVSLALVPITIGYVSSELYGIWLTLSSILTWLCFLDVGLTQGLKNKLTEAIARDDWDKAKKLVSTTYISMVVLFVPIAVILSLLVPIVNWTKLLNISAIYAEDIKKVMQLLLIFVCIQMVVNVLVSVIAAFQRVAMSQSFSVIGNIVALILIIVMTKTMPASLFNLSLVMAGPTILIMIMASFILYNTRYRRISPSFKAFDASCLKDLFSLGIKFFIINIQVVVLYQSTNILISNVSSPESVTSYNIAYRYLSIAMMLYTIITAPLWPAYTDAYTRGDYNWMKGMRSKMIKIWLICAIGCIVMAIVSQPVYKIWVGDKAYVSVIMTWMVALYVIVYAIMSLNVTLIVGMGKVYVETIVVVAGMILHIPLAIFLSRYIGEYGVLASLIIINLMYALIFHYQVSMILNNKAKGIWIK